MAFFPPPRFVTLSLVAIGSLKSCVSAQDVSFNVTGYDVGPDWEKDEFPPYPPLTDDQGKRIDANNLRGTRLFGYTGCGFNEKKAINEAYDDFYYLAQQEELFKNIAWNDQPAKEFWGAAAGRTPIPDKTKEEIRRECPVS